MKRSLIKVTGQGLFLVLLTACGAAGQMYQVALSYHEDSASVQKLSYSPRIVVFPFEDVRKNPKLIGQRTHLFGQVDSFQTKVPSDEKFSLLLVEALKRHGWTVSLAERGEKPGESGADQVVTGKIRTLWAKADSHIGYTQIDARVEFQIEIFDRRTGNVTTFRIKNETSPKVFIFHSESIQDSLNELVSNGLNNLQIASGATHAFRPSEIYGQ